MKLKLGDKFKVYLTRDTHTFGTFTGYSKENDKPLLRFKDLSHVPLRGFRKLLEIKEVTFVRGNHYQEFKREGR